MQAREILVVEDSVATRQAVRDLLEAEGYGVACAANGQEALDYLQRDQHPCLILLDLQMPVMDGWHFCEQRRRTLAWAAIPVVLLSAEGDLPQQAASLGVADYLQKPVEAERLLGVVRRYGAD